MVHSSSDFNQHMKLMYSKLAVIIFFFSLNNPYRWFYRVSGLKTNYFRLVQNSGYYIEHAGSEFNS